MNPGEPVAADLCPGTLLASGRAPSLWRLESVPPGAPIAPDGGMYLAPKPCEAGLGRPPRQESPRQAALIAST
jgi:hypothetical protein